MKPNEHLFLECMKNMLDQSARLGVPKEPAKDGGPNDPRCRGLQYLHTQIDEMFAHKAAELTHHDNVCSAFSRIHGHCYISDPRFVRMLDRELTSRGVPVAERQKAAKFIPAILEELGDEMNNGVEQHYGYHPNLDEIIEVSQPQQYET